MKNVLIVGCGHMGSALLEAWSKNILYNFIIIDPKKYNLVDHKYKTNKIKSYKSISEINNTNLIDIILIAVTPQLANSALQDYKFIKFKKSCILISIVAGKKIIFFKKFFPNIKQVIRVMPNMPALVGEGVSCLVANRFVSRKNKNIILKLFTKVGISIWLRSEKEIDIITAISGSGPGYILYLIHIMEKASHELGLSKQLNRKIIFQTFLGSLKLFQNTNQSAIQLSNIIAIKGGTTEAGLKVMKNSNLNKIFSKTFFSAYKKAQQLGKK